MWHLQPPERFVAFRHVTEQTHFPSGYGLPGRVQTSGQLAWISDVATAPDFLRTQLAQDTGVNVGFAFPMLVGTDVVAVLEFFSDHAVEADAAFVEAMSHLSTQRGRVVEHQRAKELRQRQQEALDQREKLAAMGSLLANVAYELSNPLSVVMIQADLLGEELGNAPVAEQVKAITQSPQRCVRIVRNFLTLARQHVPERSQGQRHAVSAEAMELLTYSLWLDNIDVRLECAADLLPVAADPHPLYQGVVNLVTNAHNALRETSLPHQLTLTTRAEAAQGRVVFEVADTGLGIPPHLQARIFEPFYTTKPSEVGTGLGLPLCQGIISVRFSMFRYSSCTSRKQFTSYGRSHLPPGF
jgi:signal transduction histidine kinase